MDNTTSHGEPSERSSVVRTFFFTGSCSDPHALSGNSEVGHVDSPIVASTPMLPKALRCPAAAMISSASQPGSVTKCHEPGLVLVCSQRLQRKRNRGMRGSFHAGLTHGAPSRRGEGLDYSCPGGPIGGGDVGFRSWGSGDTGHDVRLQAAKVSCLRRLVGAVDMLLDPWRGCDMAGRSKLRTAVL
jgi:hypothetical protein